MNGKVPRSLVGDDQGDPITLAIVTGVERATAPDSRKVRVEERITGDPCAARSYERRAPGGGGEEMGLIRRL